MERIEPSCLHHFFERQAARVPDAIAVEHVEAGVRLTYRELELRSRAVAELLRARGIGPDDRVGLYVHRSIELYVTMLGVLRAGAAYVPIDAQHPPERVRFLLEDSGARLVFATRDRASIAAASGVEVLAVEDLAVDVAPEALSEPPSGAPLGPCSPEHLAYIIYTSGTTGQPKGVCLSHVNAVTYVRGMLQVYGVRDDERILQGFSTAFDASVEEIWMAFATGSTLVVGTLETMRAVDELADRLRDFEITIFSTVPTLLRVVDADALPLLRLIIAGGEAVHADVIDRWARPGRRFLNSYGPTETTVVCTYSWCLPGQPVTIGGPLPGYEAVVVDSELHEVPNGTEGELCIGGSAVSLRGYLNRAELTAEKFIDRGGVRFYRTGDLVRREAENLIYYLGRIDAQVKVRGYRVELEDVETHLSRTLQTTSGGEEIQGAIVALREVAQVSELVAYLLCPLEPEYLDLRGLVSALRKKLPPYMVPSHFAWLDPAELPRMTSGKVDRRLLPPIALRRLVLAPSMVTRVRSVEAVDAELSVEERLILGVWRTVLQAPTLETTDSFFEFGGNSILAGQSISQFRKHPDLALLTIRDTYNAPTAAVLAQRLRDRMAERATSPSAIAAGPRAKPRAVHRAPRGQYLAVWAAQTLVILAMLTSGAYLAYWLLVGSVELARWNPWILAGAAVAALAVAGFVLPLAITLLGRLLLGSVREGDYPVWSWGYFRWWLLNIVHGGSRGLAQSYLGTPLAGVFYRLAGGRIGKNVYLASPLLEPELVTIGDDVSISEEVALRTHAIEEGVLKLRRVYIGAGAYVGAQCVVSGGVRMEEKSKLHPLSCLASGTVVPAGTEWRGSPATQVAPGTTALSRMLSRHEEQTRPQDGWARGGRAAKVMVAQLLLGYIANLPRLGVYALELWLMVRLGALSVTPLALDLPLALALVLPFAFARNVAELGLLIFEKWVFTGRARAGTISLSSYEYVRRWFCGRLMRFLVEPGGLRAFTETLLMPIVCRMLGMKVGKGAEISDAFGFQPDLVTIGENAMLADQCVLGVPIVHRGLMTLGPVSVGDRSFVANVAHMPITTPELLPGSLIGVLSVPPDEPPPASDWLGSPPMRMPNRSRHGAPDARTFQPARHLLWARAFFNIWKIVLPGAVLETVGWAMFGALLWAQGSSSGAALYGLLPLIFIAGYVATCCAPMIMKWLVIGRYTAGERYLYSFWMWRNEITYEVELLVNSTATMLLDGTPWMAVLHRATGAKIGKQVLILQGRLMEADLTEIGDHSAIEGFLQTHLFEDRVMKLGKVIIGDDCTVGRESCVLYDSRMGDRSSLGDLSLIMKRETFLPDHRYRGLPAENVPEPADRATSIRTGRASAVIDRTSPVTGRLGPR